MQHASRYRCNVPVWSTIAESVAVRPNGVRLSIMHPRHANLDDYTLTINLARVAFHSCDNLYYSFMKEP